MRLSITTSVSQRFNILCIMFKIIAFIIITLFARLHVRIGILLTSGKHLHNDTISLLKTCKREVCLNLPLFTVLHVFSIK